MLGVAIFVPGVDFPVLTLNQLRLVLRLASAHGDEIDQSRLPELLGDGRGGLRLPRRSRASCSASFRSPAGS